MTNILSDHKHIYDSNGNMTCCLLDSKKDYMKIIYFITMGLILFTVVFNIYCLLHFAYNKTFYSLINTAVPIITLVYLILIIKRKKALFKKIDEAIHKIFSKN